MIKAAVMKVDCRQPDESTIQEAIAVLQKGGLVVAPTETRYGLLVRADWKKSLKKLYKIKKRPVTSPTALFVKALEQIAEYGMMTPTARALAEAFLPGPLTLVLKALHQGEPPVVVEGKIGLRYSSSTVIKEIVDRLVFPVTATSANKSGQPEFEQIDEIARSLGRGVDLYLDAGKLDNPVSTVVDCSGPGINVIREGFILKKNIDEILNKAGFI
ncbi:MAG: L-threonylcarbamoyladenylate synthase [candidate division Zixibacteria bacterium]|nr:L-threonylcarbamoyladenylate synthase [candidate division Zixibacteria bacterium]